MFIHYKIFLLFKIRLGFLKFFFPYKIYKGSICHIAAGEYEGYVAEPRACEWDIAAGHAILKHAGGKVTDFDGNKILYGKKNFKNPSLILKSKNIL